MSFLTPFAFFFAAALPVVIVFYLLKRKRTVKLVSSTLLWQKFLAESQANAPFQRLRHNWLLLLQLLLLALVIFALARPYFASHMSGGNFFVIILDASASMQSTDVTPSRFEQARAAAMQFVNTLQESDRMLVLQSSGYTEVKQSATSEKSSLRRAIEGCVVTDSSTRLAEALKLADSAASAHDKSKTEIHLFSDGAVPDLSEFENKGLRVVLHTFGQRANNLAITTLDTRTHPEDSSQRAIFATVANYSTNIQTTEVELRFNDRVLETRPLVLKPRDSSPQVFLSPQSRDGVFTVRLTSQDDLVADNQASAVSLLPQPMKVLLVSKGNRFLEKALRAVANVQLLVAQDLTDEGKAFDIVVLDDVTPTAWPAVNLLAIHTLKPGWFEAVTKVAGPPIVDWKSTHPLLRFANFDTVQVSESIGVKAPSWGVTVVDSPQTPLVLAGEISRQRVVWIGFDTLQSTWPLRISYPIFMANAMDWLNPANMNTAQLSVHAAEPFRLTVSEPVATAQVLMPDGATRPLKLDPGAREIVFGDTLRQGIYRMRAGTNEITFCVNVLDAAESDTTPKEELKLGKYATATTATTTRANLEIWRWFALVGLALLMFEWWFYHRRTA